MAYTINKTDGTILTTVPDGQIDNFTTGVSLIGKNYSGFGEFLNENFVKILENFSGTVRPSNPIRGQLWYDIINLKLKVYNGTDFVPVGTVNISDTQPPGLSVGDLWYKGNNKQLFFYDGTNPILIGPVYSSSQGLSGFKVDSITDTLNQTRIITYLYNSGVLLGIYSTSAFTPRQAIDGFTGDINVGFNASNLSGYKFNVTATNAEQLGGAPASTYLRNDQSNIVNGSLVLSNDLGLTLGSANQGLFQIQDSRNLVVSNVASNGNLILRVRRAVSSESAVEISSENRKISLYSGFPDSEVSVGGNLVVEGNLTVNGTSTAINVDSLVVEDKTIELAVTLAPTDTTADGGGIIVKGGTDHSLLWSNFNDQSNGIAKDSWNSSEHINLKSNREYKINGVTVLSANALGSTITSIPGVTNFGKQILIKVGPGTALDPEYLRLENNRISTTVNSSPPDLELAPYQTGNVVLIGNPKITGLANPTGEQDAATKEYVDSSLGLKPLVFSIDISDGIDNISIASLLDNLAPPEEYRNGTIARLLCTSITNSTSNLDINPLVTLTTDTFNTPTGTADAVTNVTVSTATVPASTVNVSRVIKTFQISGGSWVFVS